MNKTFDFYVGVNSYHNDLKRFMEISVTIKVYEKYVPYIDVGVNMTKKGNIEIFDNLLG